MPAAHSKMTVGQVGDAYLSSVKKTVAPTTYNRYEQLVRVHIKPNLGHQPIGDLVPFQVEAFYGDLSELDVKPATQYKAGQVLSYICKFAVKNHLLAYNPCRDVAKPRFEEEEFTVLTPDQANKLLEHAESDRLYALYVLALTSGMRSGELYGLHWSDIDFDAEAVSVQRTLEEVSGVHRVKPPKTPHSRRRIDLPKIAIDALREHLKLALVDGHAKAPVFCDSRGGYLRRPNVTQRSFQPLLEAAGMPDIRFHDLRHTCATLLLVAGVNPKVVSERLGHSSVQVTLDRYSHVLPTMQKEAAAKLDRLFA